jgi:hypothetical protein
MTLEIIIKCSSCFICRKKTSNDENSMGRVHIKWAISQDQTEKLYSELGVENISDESSDSCYALELTPAVFVNKDKPVAPGVSTEAKHTFFN